MRTADLDDALALVADLDDALTLVRREESYFPSEKIFSFLSGVGTMQSIGKLAERVLLFYL